MVPLMAGQMPVVVVVSGGEFAVASHDRRHARSRRALLLPPSLPVFLLLWFRLRCPARGVYPATEAAHAAPVLIHLFHCTAIIFAAVAAALYLRQLRSCGGCLLLGSESSQLCIRGSSSSNGPSYGKS